MLQIGDKFTLSDGRQFTVGELVSEGKTKVILALVEDKALVIVVSKNDITAHNDPSLTKQFPDKGKYANLTTCAIFEFLNAFGIPTAFVSRVADDDTAFVAQRCKMLPLEVVARRRPRGSYLKRHPGRPVGSHWTIPVQEFFLKTTNGQLVVEGKVLVSGFDSEQEDPLIENLRLPSWHLFHPKLPLGGAGSFLHCFVPAQITPYQANIIQTVNLGAFEAVSAAFELVFNWTLIDWKLEFGLNTSGELVIADVIDNDSWRMEDEDGREVSKELFRQGGELGTVADSYAQVADAAQQLLSRFLFLNRLER